MGNITSFDDSKKELIQAKFMRLKRIMGTTQTREKALGFIKSENQYLTDAIRDAKIAVLQAKRRANVDIDKAQLEEDRLRHEIEEFTRHIGNRQQQITALRDQYAERTLAHQVMMRKRRRDRRYNTVYCTYSDH